MARRKRVRQTSEREVGMFDMVSLLRNFFHLLKRARGGGGIKGVKREIREEEMRNAPRIPERFERVRYIKRETERER